MTTRNKAADLLNRPRVQPQTKLAVNAALLSAVIAAGAATAIAQTSSQDRYNQDRSQNQDNYAQDRDRYDQDRYQRDGQGMDAQDRYQTQNRYDQDRQAYNQTQEWHEVEEWYEVHDRSDRSARRDFYGDRASMARDTHQSDWYDEDVYGTDEQYRERRASDTHNGYTDDEWYDHKTFVRPRMEANRNATGSYWYETGYTSAASHDQYQDEPYTYDYYSTNWHGDSSDFAKWYDEWTYSH